MTINAISSLQRSLFTGNDAAMLITPTMGSSATTISAQPLIPEGTLETGFQNDARHPGQQALARIVEILDLMRPSRAIGADTLDDDVLEPAYQNSVQAVSAFLSSLEDFNADENPAFVAMEQTDTSTGQTVLQSFYRQF